MQNHKEPSDKRDQVLWSDGELLAAVDAYTYMLRLQQRGMTCTESMTTPLLMSGPLAGRNDASIRYRMRNISAVFQGLGAPVLDIYSPAEQVGTGVRERLRQMILAHPAFEQLRQVATTPLPPPSSGAQDREGAFLALKDLRRRIDDFEASLGGIGHNHPPEAIDSSFGRDEILKIKDDIGRLEAELSKPKMDISAQRKILEQIIGFGLKLSLWVGQRLTKFVDAALVTTAPIVVAKATDVLPGIIDAVHSVAQLIGR